MSKRKRRQKKNGYFKNDLAILNSLKASDFDTMTYEDLSCQSMIYVLPGSVWAVIRVNHSCGCCVVEHTTSSIKETGKLLHHIRDADPDATVLVMDQDQMFLASFTQPNA
jgi:hypothetical protein